MSDIPAELDGFTKWGGEEPFEDYVGPFFMKLDAENGNHLAALKVEQRHLNGGDFLHGGLLMTFADYALFVIAHSELDGGHGVTVSCQTEFLKGANPKGKYLHAYGEVTRNARSLIFVRGNIIVEGDPDNILATFTGIIKRVKQ